jgi:hypothetical protein
MSSQLPVEFDVVRKQIFVENLSLGMSPVDAARTAGFTTNLKRVATQLLEDEETKEMVESVKRQIAHRYDISREKVLRDLVDAKEIARVQADPKGMVMALKEVSEVMGYHAPKQLSMEQAITVHDEAKSRLRQMPDHKLLELAEDANFEVLELESRDE